jgi:uncharacterized protein (TIGR02246 family)
MCRTVNALRSRRFAEFLIQASFRERRISGGTVLAMRVGNKAAVVLVYNQFSMRTTALRIVVAAIVVATPALAAEGTPQDEQMIRTVISDLYEAWNSHDAAAIVKDFTADHDHINTFGGWAKSKAQIEQVYVRGHASGGPLTRSGEKKHVVEKIKFIRADIAEAIVNTTSTRNKDISTWVLTKEGSRWLVANFHNTTHTTPPGATPQPEQPE